MKQHLIVAGICISPGTGVRHWLLPESRPSPPSARGPAGSLVLSHGRVALDFYALLSTPFSSVWTNSARRSPFHPDGLAALPEPRVVHLSPSLGPHGKGVSVCLLCALGECTVGTDGASPFHGHFSPGFWLFLGISCAKSSSESHCQRHGGPPWGSGRACSESTNWGDPSVHLCPSSCTPRAASMAVPDSRLYPRSGTAGQRTSALAGAGQGPKAPRRHLVQAPFLIMTQSPPAPDPPPRSCTPNQLDFCLFSSLFLVRVPVTHPCPQDGDQTL